MSIELNLLTLLYEVSQFRGFQSSGAILEMKGLVNCEFLPFKDVFREVYFSRDRPLILT